MTDPWCWEKYANKNVFFLVGIHGTAYQHHGSFFGSGGYGFSPVVAPLVPIQCEAPGHDSVQLVPITPISRTGLWYTYDELVTGAYKPTYNWGASHCI